MFTSYLDELLLSFADLPSEAALLAAICNDPTGRTFWEVSNFISQSTFLSQDHQKIWEQVAISLNTNASLPTFPDADPSPEAVLTAKKLADLQKRRSLAAFGDQFWKDLRTETSGQALIERTENAISLIRQQTSAQVNRRLVSVGDLFENGILRAEEAWKLKQTDPNGILGIPTSIDRLDDLIGGYQTGVHVVAAVPGVGKTTYIRQATSVASKQGYAALVLSFEESVDTLAFRYLCSNAIPFLDSKALMEGYENPSGLREIATSVARSLKHLYLVQGSVETTIAEVKGRVRAILNNSEVKGLILVVDYLQIWAGKASGGNELRAANTQLLGGIRDISIEYKIPALVISSQNRNGYESSGFASLKESGDIEYSADTIMFMVEIPDLVAKENGSRVIKFDLRKNRYGDRGEFQMEFCPQYGYFVPFKGG